jgi:hypothetical protein
MALRKEQCSLIKIKQRGEEKKQVFNSYCNCSYSISYRLENFVFENELKKQSTIHIGFYVFILSSLISITNTTTYFNWLIAKSE